jgi:hypothetical protein
MDLSYSAEYEAFREEVRGFLDREWTSEDRAAHGGGEVLIGRIHRPEPRVTEFRIRFRASGAEASSRSIR